MTRAQLKTKLVQMLEENVGREFSNIQESDDLRASLGLDSVDLVTLLIEIQGQLGVVVANEELMDLKTVGTLLDLLERKTAVRKAA